MIPAFLRYFSFLFHGLLAVVLLCLSGLALIGDPGALRLDVLPWTGSTLAYVVFFSALFGLVAVVLAVLRKVPVLLLVWSLAVPIMLIRGYVFSQYGFAPGEWVVDALFVTGSAIAIFGPWLQMRNPRN